MRRRAVALGCGVLVLAGCGSTGSGHSVLLQSGQAAVSSEFQVAQQLVADDVARVLAGLGLPPGEAPAGLASATAQRLVQSRLIASYAEDNGIEVTRTEVEEGLASLAADNGGQAALERSALQSGIPVESLDEFVETNLIAVAIGTRLSAEGDPVAQVESARAALVAYSEQIDVAVAPRYGTWDDQQLIIVPGSDLSRAADEG